MRNQRTPPNAVIERKLFWQEDENGQVTVFRPCLGNNRFGKRIAAFFGFADYRIKLDQIGSEVWRLSNGQRHVEQIKALLEEKFPEEESEDLGERLDAFLKKMNQTKMISILIPKTEEFTKYQNR